MNETSPGRLIVVSGPSGVGKTTLLREVLRRSEKPLRMSISATTRPPRKGETDGVDYYFLSDEQFATRRRAGQFIECFEVFGRGYWYGTLCDEVGPSLDAGNWVVLEIDVQGTAAVVKEYPDAVTIFVGLCSIEQIERRLRGRDTDSEQAIQRRLEVARREVAAAGRYQHKVINDNISRAADEICEILNQVGRYYNDRRFS